MPSGLLLLLLLLLLCFVAVSPRSASAGFSRLPSAAASHPAESIYADWTAAPTFVPEQTSGASDGPLLGNGDLGVAVSSVNGSNTFNFHIGLNQFWSLNSTEHTPAQSQVRTVGGLSLTFLDQPSALHFTARQFLYNASLLLSLSSSDGSEQYRVSATIHSRSNLLLLRVAASSSSSPSSSGRVRSSQSLLNLTTYTVGPFPTRSGSSQLKDGHTAHFITRDSFWPNNSFPITAAVVTRPMGPAVQLVNSSHTPVSATSILGFTDWFSIATLVWTNLDEAGMDQADYEPPAPVTGVDPLPSALLAASLLNASTVDTAWQDTADDWAQFWQSTCVVRLPSLPLLERYYYGAQYILKASTALGKVQPGLWGPWIIQDNMNWNGDYTYNYNSQAPQYGTYSSNQLDLAMASYLPIFQYMPQARLNARQLKNCSTPLCFHFPVHVAPWGRSSVGGPQGDWRQQFIGTFVLLNPVTHCLYTNDQQWCARVYEAMKGALEWWRFYLQRETVDGGADYRYVDPDDCSNEGCDGEKMYNGLLPLAMIRRVLQWMIQTAAERNIDPDLRAQWTEQLTHLSQLPTTAALPPYSNLTIFNLAEDNSSDSTPRPDSNPLAVYPIWPAELLSIHSPVPAARLALNTIRIYSGGWTQPNALPIFHPAAVRIGYPASDVLDGWTARLQGCLLTNLYCYQAGGGIETSGATMAVNEMLMQSNEWAVNLFPVWPSQLDASFVAMRARGNVLVSAAYNQSAGRVEGVEMWPVGHGQREVRLRLMHPWQYSQREKEQRARARLAGVKPAERRAADVRPVRIVQLDGSGGEELVVSAARHSRPPQALFAGAAEYEGGEDVLWFDWLGCAGCRYRITELTEAEAEVETGSQHRHARSHE